VTDTPVVSAIDLVKEYRLRARPTRAGRRAILRAVDHVSLGLVAGQTLALVGESGSGKTTAARMILGVEEPTSGTVYHDGVELHALDRAGRRAYRRSVQAVFQDPYSSLDPRMRVWASIAEPIRNLSRVSRAHQRRRAADLMDVVGLDRRRVDSFPRDFSGGQQQRIALARALASEPRVIVLDEPISALDVSIGAQIMNLLRDLQDRTRVGYLLIAHDLATVRHLAHEVAVMFRGRVVERGDAETIFRDPLHPYTKLLLESARSESLTAGSGAVERDEAGEHWRTEHGCPFVVRCPSAVELCRLEAPDSREVGGRRVECHLYGVAPTSVTPRSGHGPATAEPAR
jgi:oligopeptide/dipeptide ABC transporter ATP-binding protein